MISKVADWTTIVTGPLSLAISLAAWRGALVSAPHSLTPLTQFSLSLAAVLIVWTFLLLAHFRVTRFLQSQASDFAVFLVAGLSGLLGFGVLVVIELLILDQVYGGALPGFGVFFWLAGTAFFWAIAAMFVVFAVVESATA